MLINLYLSDKWRGSLHETPHQRISEVFLTIYFLDKLVMYELILYELVLYELISYFIMT